VKYRDVEYSLVHERYLWRWSVQIEGIVVRGQAPTEAKAIAEVERVIDRAKAVNPVRPWGYAGALTQTWRRVHKHKPKTAPVAGQQLGPSFTVGTLHPVVENQAISITIVPMFRSSVISFGSDLIDHL
jgi:hypothetical protein